MEFLEQILNWIVSLGQMYPWAIWIGVVFSLLGTLVTVASAVIAATPSQADDAWWAGVRASPVLGKIVATLEKFSLVKRKEALSGSSELDRNDRTGNEDQKK